MRFAWIYMYEPRQPSWLENVVCSLDLGAQLFPRRRLILLCRQPAELRGLWFEGLGAYLDLLQDVSLLRPSMCLRCQVRVEAKLLRLIHRLLVAQVLLETSGEGWWGVREVETRFSAEFS